MATVHTIADVRSATPRLKAVELVRALAAILVLAQHVKAIAGDDFAIAFPGGVAGFIVPGVDLFFVLSGAMMVRAYGKDFGIGKRLAAFVGQRASRLLPLLWLLITLKIALLIAFPSLSREDRATWDIVLASYFMLPLPWPAVFPIIGVAWTLAHELIFYIIVGLGIVIGKRAFWIGLAVWAAAAIYANLLAPLNTLAGAHYLVRFILNERNAEFLAGALAYRVGGAILGSRRPTSVLLPVALLVASAAWFTTAAYIDVSRGPGNISLLLGYGLPSALIVLAALVVPDGVLSHPPIARLIAFPRQVGLASYSLFLSHFLTLDAMVLVLLALKIPTNGALSILLLCALLAGAIVIALALRRWVESPLISATRRWLNV